VLPPHLPSPPPGRTILLAIGKAAGGMAKLVEQQWQGPLSGLCVDRMRVPELVRIDSLAAAHPVPDESSVAAGRRLLALAHQAQRADLVLVLLSGGASALACVPGAGLSLAGKRAVTEALLRSGAAVSEINCVRRHLSDLKGGRLARAAQPARVVTLAISDVVGGRPEDIGSGPTAPDPTSLDEARAIAARYGCDPGRGWSESIEPGEAESWNLEYRIVARNDDALDAAAAQARALGYAPLLLPAVTGEAREVVGEHARLALAQTGRTALISGGELTVTVTGKGRGGPSQEYALALAEALRGAPGIHALAADTDGIDGAGAAAGAFAAPDTLPRAAALGLDPAQALQRNDSGSFFAALGDLFVTGPTGTNVSDLRIVLTEGAGRSESRRGC
jgi:hydroxypyruvate reductase